MTAGVRPNGFQGTKSGFQGNKSLPRSLWTWAPTGVLDLALLCVLVSLAALAYMVLPGGSVVRVALALAVLFFVPGQLLIEAAAGPARTHAQRFLRACIAVGVSPAVVGLLALATAVLPGGFRPDVIVTTVTVGCLALAGVALLRRRRASAVALPTGPLVSS